MLQDMQDKLVSGGQQLDQKEAEQLAAQREYQAKIKEQRKKAKRLLEEKKLQEDALMNAKNAYKDMAEELVAYKEMTKKLKLKYDSALNEIKDLQSEQTGEKEDLMI